jgi:hypothetical protein
MRPLTLLLIVPILACAEQAAQPARPAAMPANAVPTASMPRTTQPAPLPSDRAFGTPLGQRAVEPGYDPLNTGAMEQYPSMPQQTSPAFQGL